MSAPDITKAENIESGYDGEFGFAWILFDYDCVEYMLQGCIDKKGRLNKQNDGTTCAACGWVNELAFRMFSEADCIPFFYDQIKDIVEVIDERI